MRLENWAFVPQMGYLVGDVYGDEKGRFVDGCFIHTSQVKQNPETFKEGVVVKTKYSTYILGVPFSAKDNAIRSAKHIALLQDP